MDSSHVISDVGVATVAHEAASDAQTAVLHAKALIIDGARALIGSANLTGRALTANLEVGVLIRDSVVAAALEAHVRELMERGVLVAAEPSKPRRS